MKRQGRGREWRELVLARSCGGEESAQKYSVCTVATTDVHDGAVTGDLDIAIQAEPQTVLCQLYFSNRRLGHHDSG